MQTVTRKKLEIIVEAPVLRRVEAMLDEAGVRGWTVVPSLEGHGGGGSWRGDAPSESETKRLLIAIASEAAAERALERLHSFFLDYPGIVCVSDVEVLRSERF